MGLLKRIMDHHHQNAYHRYRNAKSTGDRLASWARDHVGSWYAIVLTAGLISAWVLKGGLYHDDPYPYFFLALIMTCISVLQGIMILIISKHQERMSESLSFATHELALHTAKETEAIHGKLDKLIEKNES